MTNQENHQTHSRSKSVKTIVLLPILAVILYSSVTRSQFIIKKNILLSLAYKVVMVQQYCTLTLAASTSRKKVYLTLFLAGNLTGMLL